MIFSVGCEKGVCRGGKENEGGVFEMVIYGLIGFSVFVSWHLM